MRKWKNSNLVIVAVLGVLALCGTTRADLTDGLVSHWEFEEGTGVIAGDSAGNNHGLLQGNPSWTAGQIGGALDFDGDGDYINCGNNESLDVDEITISAWINSNVLSGSSSRNKAIVTKLQDNLLPNEVAIEFSQSKGDYSKLVFGFKDGSWHSWLTVNSVMVGGWMHVAVTYDGVSDPVFYVNGAIEANNGGGTPAALPANTADLTIGAQDATNPSAYFDGKIDDVRIYDRVLSAEEVEELYQGQLLSLEVVGPDEVAEDFHAQYKAIAHYGDGDTQDVTGLAIWSVEPNDIADIAAGLLTTEMIDSPEDVTITAEYSEGDIAVEAEKIVNIFAICPSGTTLDFDGVDDYVNCGNDESLDVAAITISAWINSNVLSGSSSRNKAIVTKLQDNLLPNEVAIEFSQSKGDYSKLVFAFKDGSWHSWLTVNSVMVGGWMHVAVTYDGLNDPVFYVNGVFEANNGGGTPAALPTNTADLTIGAQDATSPAAYFDGEIDDVRIYDRALSGEEILEIMHTRPGGPDPNLVGYWDFDEGTGQVAGDSSLYGNDGQLGSGPGDDDSDPAWVESDAPIGICTPAALDIKPGSCPNPLNLKSKGVLPVAILGTEDFDVSTIDTFSIRLEDVAAIRGGYEDVATAVTGGEECECTEDGPDGYVDLALKFSTQEIVEELIMNRPGELVKGQTLALTLTGELLDGTGIEGIDCVKLVGNVPKALAARRLDYNEDGVVDFFDFAAMAEYWLEDTDY